MDEDGVEVDKDRVEVEEDRVEVDEDGVEVDEDKVEVDEDRVEVDEEGVEDNRPEDNLTNPNIILNSTTIKKRREYLHPIYEAIHAPYKNNKEFFFSFSIIFIAFLYMLSYILLDSNPTVGLAVGIPVSCIYFEVAAFS